MAMFQPEANAALMEAAFERALAKFGEQKPKLGSLGTITILFNEGLVACAEARQQTLETLAAAVRKFAPDLADELCRRWKEAQAKSDEALEELLAALSEQTAAEESK